MKFFTIFILLFVTLLGANDTLGKSVTLIKISEITEDLINNPNILLYEREDGLIEIENFQTAEYSPTLTISDSDVIFFISTPEKHQEIQINASQANKITELTNFQLNRDTVILIHGWRNDYTSPLNVYVKEAFLKNRNINIIIVDWNKIAGKNYISAKGSVLAVGNFIGDFLLTLQIEFNYDLKNRITLVGHSLGAHIAGNAGARTGSLVNTIVGLDPAGPLFTIRNIDNRLDPTDAQYVHCVHTNDALLGFKVSLGHVDVYPNGGVKQPGCGLDLIGTCSHSRAYYYYAESINNNKFKSKLCPNYSLYESDQCYDDADDNDNNGSDVTFLGSYPVTRPNSDGDYYLETNGEPPYARG